MKKAIILLLLLVALPLALSAQKRDKTLTVKVTATTGENLAGQVVDITQADYSLSYGTIKLDASGQCQVKAYAGNHSVTVKRPGYYTASATFTLKNDFPITRPSPSTIVASTVTSATPASRRAWTAATRPSTQMSS